MPRHEREVTASHPLAAAFLLGAGVTTAAYLGAVLAFSALRMVPRQQRVTMHELKAIREELSHLQVALERIERHSERTVYASGKGDQRETVRTRLDGNSDQMGQATMTTPIGGLPEIRNASPTTTLGHGSSPPALSPTIALRASPPITVPRDPLFLAPRPVVPSKPIPRLPVPGAASHSPLSRPAPLPTPIREPTSLFAWQGLRAGASRMGPMPIVDASNPNYITFARAVQERGEESTDRRPLGTPT